MQDRYWYKPYCNFDLLCCCNCAVVHNSQSFFQPWIYRQNEEEEQYEPYVNQYQGFDEDLLINIPEEDLIIDIPEKDLQVSVPENEELTQNDLERVLEVIRRESRYEIRDFEKMGIDRRLLNYLVKSMVGYIDKNYNRYKGTFNQKVNEAMRDLKMDLIWVFEILQALETSQTTINRLVDKTARISLLNLRPLSLAAMPRR